MAAAIDQVCESTTKRALRRILELQQEVEKLKSSRAAPEPIAVVGIGCRFPGNAGSPAAFWDLLLGGASGIADIPATRWSAQEFHTPGHPVPGKTYAGRGGLIEEIECFDSTLFGISAQEAQHMDPQQRLLLETTWHAFEDANLPLKPLRGAAVGTFMAMGEVDYSRWSYHSGKPERIGPYTKLGVNRALGVGRINYQFDFRGPALFLDTTCSSSLLAAHLACQSLRQRECDFAIAGGINLMLTPEDYIGFSALSALSPTDRCMPFDASADGYVRGEGCGVVVLMRLSDAQRKGSRIYCTLSGSASNHDGRSNGLTAPNGRAQSEVIQQALANANMTAESIGYVEAHGTGTKLGDPIEVGALAKALKRDWSSAPPLAIGSLKGQIGHLESAAGVASIIKAALIQYHGQLPGNHHLQEINPLINLRGTSIDVPAKNGQWPLNDQSTAIGVSGFGMSGTNVHIVVAAAPATAEAIIVAPPQSAGPQVLAFSTASRDTASKLARLHADRLANASEADFWRYCAASRQNRDKLSLGFAVRATTSSEMMERLREFDKNYETYADNAPTATADHRFGHVALPLYPFARTAHWVGGERSAYSLGSSTAEPQGVVAEDIVTTPIVTSIDSGIPTTHSQVLSLLGKMVNVERWQDRDMKRPLAEFGLESVGALECSQLLLDSFNITVRPLDILEKPIQHILDKTG